MDDTPAHEALREAIANCLTNANWFDRRGVVCVWDDEAMMRMFAMVEIGERAGSGMGKIFEGWRWAGYDAPRYEVAFGPDRTTLTLPLTYAGGESAGKVSTDKSRQISQLR